MSRVQAEVESHYRSTLVERLRAQGGVLRAGNTTIRLAKQFGFCYGVERAIDLAYAACKVFPDNRIYLLGEIIHNPDVNAQLAEMGVRHLKARPTEDQLASLKADDIVIVPAFGAEVSTVNAVKAIGCQIVDTTCGDVMSVWKRVRQNAKEEVTSIIHGKSSHEETRATASRALGNEGGGHYLIVLNAEETDIVCDYMRNGGNKEEFLARFARAHSRDSILISISTASVWQTKPRCCEARPRTFRGAYAGRSLSAMAATARISDFSTPSAVRHRSGRTRSFSFSTSRWTS